MPRATNKNNHQNKRESKSHSIKGDKKRKNNKKNDHSLQQVQLMELKVRPKIQVIRMLEDQLGRQLPGHYQLGIWRKDIKCLTRSHLAPFAKIIKMDEMDNSFLNPITGSVSGKRKANKNQILVEFPNNRRSIMIKMGEFPILLVLQNICFYELNFSTFQQLFSDCKHTKQDLARIFKAIKQGISDQLTQCIDIDDQQTVLWPAAIMQILNFENDIIQEAIKNFQINQQQNIKLLTRIKKNIVTATTNISQSFQSNKNIESQRQIQYDPLSAVSISEIDGKSSIAGQGGRNKFNLSNIDDNISQIQQRRSQIRTPKSYTMLKQFNNEEQQEQDMMNQMQLEMLDQNLSVMNVEGSQANRNNLLKKMEEISFVQKQIVTEKSFSIWLIGTSNYLSKSSGLVPWNSVPKENREQIFKKTQMKQLLQPVNQVINALNKFQENSRCNLKQEDWRLFLYRLSYYTDKSRQQLTVDSVQNYRMCIPLRFSNMKEDGKKVLIRIMNDSTQNLQQPITQLKWVPFEHVLTNYQLPILTKQQLSLLYIINIIPPLQIISKYFYRQFYHITSQQQQRNNIGQIFRTLYPQFHMTQQQVENQRCFYCYYTIRNMEFQCCFFCHKFSHKECSDRIYGKQQDFTNNTENEKVSRMQNNLGLLESIGIIGNPDIQYDQYTPKWICEQCQPCSLCFQAVGINFLKCNICLSYLHLLCGKLKGLEDSQKILTSEYKEKYICQSCLKCRMCNLKLRDQEYTLVRDDFFCSECSQKINKNQHCHICLKERDGSWTQCDIPECGKWIHDKCDPEYVAQLEGSKTEESKYTCPICRRKQVRNVFVELIKAITIFDQLQFFIEPSYESIPLYTTIISQPMCFSKMKEKALMGYYDTNPYQLIRKDFLLIVNNAFQFNMPKDSPYFQAKILKILGEMALQHLKQYFTPKIKLLLNHEIWTQILQARQNLHNKINQHYPQILINYGCTKSYIEVRRKTSTTPTIAPPGPSSLLNITNSKSQPIFHSPLILNNLFKNSTVIFHLKKQKVKIESLFTIPKSQIQVGSWLPIKGLVCYYHGNCNKIIYTCSQCYQSYCCVDKCYRHHTCTACGIKGCKCDSFQCGCLPNVLKQKQKKLVISKLVNKYSHANKSNREVIMEITENYKYCWRCAKDNVGVRHCMYCDKLCSYDYKRCFNESCNKIWHNKCADGDSPVTGFPLYCNSCLNQPANKQMALNTMQQCLTLETRSKLIKLTKIQKYTRIILQIYMSIGIRMTPPEVQKLLLDNYDQFSMRQSLFKQYEMNYDLMKKYRTLQSSYAYFSTPHNKIVEDGQKFQINGELSTMLRLSAIKMENFEGNARILDEYGGRLVYGEQYLLRCRRIWWKYMKWKFLFSVPHLGHKQKLAQIINDQKFRVLAQVCQGFKTNAKDKIGKFQSCIFYNVPIISYIPDRNQNWAKELRQFYEINTGQIRKKKIAKLSSPQILTLHSYKSKILNNLQKMKQVEIQLASYSVGYSSGYRLLFSQPILSPQPISLPAQKRDNFHAGKNSQQFFPSENQFNPVAISSSPEQQKSPSIYMYITTIQEAFFNQNTKNHNSLVYRPRPIPQKYHYSPVLKRKGDINQKVSKFLQAIYQRNKCALRKGNTSILRGNSNHVFNTSNSSHDKIDKTNWIILKKWGRQLSKSHLHIHSVINQQQQSQENNQQNISNINCCLSNMKQIVIRLSKTANIWTLELQNATDGSINMGKDLWKDGGMNKKCFIVAEIQDIIRVLNKELGCKLETFKDLGEFMGFTIYEPFYKANHFTLFLQTNLVDQMPYLTRTNKIKQLYDNYQWGNDGFIYKQVNISEPLSTPASNQSHQPPQPPVQQNIRCEYNMTKKKPFYLSKRKPRQQIKSTRDNFAIKQNNQPNNGIKPSQLVTFEDLKKHLEPAVQAPIVNTNRNETSFNIKNFTIINQVFIAPSKIHKLGLFSRKHAKKGTVMIEYVGEIISQSVADLREQRFHYGCYMFGIGKGISHNPLEKKDIIDATFRGNMARYLNHSCDPNCKARTQTINNSPRILIYTIRDIHQYQELTYDYQFNVDADEKLQCTCGAKNCQGRLN